MTTDSTERARPIIVVGVGDRGLAGFEGAVDHAVEYAQRWGATVKLVHAAGSAVLHPTEDEASIYRLQLAHRLLKQAARQFARQGGGVRPEVAIAPGTGAEALIAESASAALIVLQRRRLGRFARIRVGSMSAQVAAHARCPVLVARDSYRPDPDQPLDEEPAGAAGSAPEDAETAGSSGERESTTRRGVLVAVDGRGHCDSAISCAVEEALSRGTTLTALHVWDVFPTISGPFTALPGDEQQAREAAQRTLDETLDRALAARQHPRQWPDVSPHGGQPLGADAGEVTVERRLARGPLVPTLLEAARTHELVVIARHGDGRSLYTSLGSTVRQVMDRAECPVLVAPTAESMAVTSSGVPAASEAAQAEKSA